MNDLTKTNKVRYIGVSNFDPEQIKELDPLPRFHVRIALRQSSPTISVR